MPIRLRENNYGKSAVRLLKLRRGSGHHVVHEWTVDIRCGGDFDSAHLDGDNSKILPTDTMKNSVYALASGTKAVTPEAFAVELARFFLDRNPAIARVEIDVLEQPWDRLAPGGAPHDHAFIAAGGGARGASVQADRSECRATGGLTDCLVMKTARSAFAGFPRDEYTTLAETNDRIFRTIVSAEWSWRGIEDSTFERFADVRHLLLDTFAGHDSRSVQETLYAMGRAVLEEVAEVEEIRLSLPNRHCIPFDLAKLGLENRNEIFVVTDEPYGLIEAMIGRD